MKGTWRENPLLGTPKDITSKALEMGYLSLWEPYEGNLEGGPFTGDPEGYNK
jgi:hypothetical protein